MLRTLITFLVGFVITAPPAMAQTTDPAAPAAPGSPVTGGGIEDWWWLIIVVVLIAAAIGYFMRKRSPTGRL